MPILGALADHYFRTDVEGVEHLSAGPSLLTSTHNGGMWMPDMLGLFVAFVRRFGVDAPGYGMMLDFAAYIPFYGQLATALGGIPASQQNARRVLRAGYPLMVCPGGVEDAIKPFRDRHRLQFGQRRGFIRLAIEQQVPIIPVVSVGAHETMFVLNDGRRTAQLMRIPLWLRIKTVPLALGFPWGLTIAGVGALPLPAKVTVRVLPPIELVAPPAAARDPHVVERCFEHVRQRMQAALDDLASHRRRVFFG
jgi:1-acyl-sn-glycerol-3-phosphate acyltransferase